MKRLSKLKKVMQKENDQKQNSIKGEPSFFSSLEKNKTYIKEKLGSSEDLNFTHFNIQIKDHKPIQAVCVGIDGIVDEETKRNNVLRPLKEITLNNLPNKELDQVQELISAKKIKIENDIDKAIDELLKAKAMIMLNGYECGLILSIEGYEFRSIQEPSSELSVRGAKEGFIESVNSNMAMIRRRISSPYLRFDSLNLGEYTKTNIVIGYISNIADSKVVDRVKERLKKLDVDAINSDGEIEQLIEDHPYSIFPTIGNTERPDKAATMLLEGKIIIVVNGSPTVLYVPNLFLETFVNIEDYNSRPYYSTFIRLIRFLAFLISIFAPALFITALNFNKSLIPSDIIVPIIQARETVPFPLAIEVILMILMFEVVREAGVRLPKQIGSALSIVGALILGEVTVSAGLVGAPTIVVVSLSYIASFVITPIADVTALLRIGLFIASSLFGSYGLCLATLGLLTHMVSLTSLGVPYMAPFSPTYFKDWKDAIVRLPTRLLKERSKSIPTQRTRRIQDVPNTGDKK